jgi:hypothetical protein
VSLTNGGDHETARAASNNRRARQCFLPLRGTTVGELNKFHGAARHRDSVGWGVLGPVSCAPVARLILASGRATAHRRFLRPGSSYPLLSPPSSRPHPFYRSPARSVCFLSFRIVHQLPFIRFNNPLPFSRRPLSGSVTRFHRYLHPESPHQDFTAKKSLTVV